MLIQGESTQIISSNMQKKIKKRGNTICEEIYKNDTEDLEKVSLNSDWLEAVEAKEGVKEATKEVVCL